MQDGQDAQDAQEAREGKARVLIVAHDPSVRRLLSADCARLGLEVHTAKDELRAILRGKRYPPRLLILEHQPPETDAFRVCEYLLEASRPGVDVIVLAPRPDPETLDRCDSLGAYCVPMTPESWETLRSIFEEVLGIGHDASAPIRPSRSRRPDPISTGQVHNKVLIVDDDADLARALARRLQKCGARTFTATDGIQGFRIALNEIPDLIISDSVMPNGSGDYLGWRLKSTEATRHIPIIVITGHRSGSGEDDSRSLGPDMAIRYFHKPLDMDALLAESSRHCEIHYTPFEAPH